MREGNYRTDTLFHYTKSIEDVLKIIKSGKLYPNYCKEDLSTQRYPDNIVGIPQVCFCDIPLSLANILVKYYGDYAVGFKKPWGLVHGCNPIQYINNEEILNGLIFYHKKWNEYHKNLRNSKLSFGQDISLFLNELDSNDAKTHMFGFMKKYVGEWKNEEYCNYEENEWRYIVKEGYHEIWWLWGKTEYETWRGDIHQNKPQPTEDLKLLGLDFSIDDINHIVLKDESEIPKFIDQLSDIMGQKGWSKEDYSILLSKITTFERIRNDF